MRQDQIDLVMKHALAIIESSDIMIGVLKDIGGNRDPNDFVWVYQNTAFIYFLQQFLGEGIGAHLNLGSVAKANNIRAFVQMANDHTDAMTGPLSYVKMNDVGDCIYTEVKLMHLGKDKEGLSLYYVELRDVSSEVYAEKRKAAGHSNPMDMLTGRERHIADLIKNGRTTKEIADLLDLTTKTVENHRTSIRMKLGLSGSQVHLENYLKENT